MVQPRNPMSLSRIQELRSKGLEHFPDLRILLCHLAWFLNIQCRRKGLIMQISQVENVRRNVVRVSVLTFLPSIEISSCPLLDLFEESYEGRFCEDLKDCDSQGELLF